MRWPPRARVFWPALCAVLVADGTTKEAAETWLNPAHVPHDVIGDIVRLTLTHNAGAAMDLSLGHYSRVGFSVLALVAIAILVELYRATPTTDRFRALACALIVGGAIGNLVNRLLVPAGVTDFIDVGIGSLRFWSFNVADTGVTVGATLLAAALMRTRRAVPSDRSS